jgi:hypothetical protein
MAEESENSQLDQATQISLHSMKNILGHQQQIDFFKEETVKEFADTYGINLENQISRFGIDLNDVQQRMMEAILLGFTLTKYKGNVEPMDKSTHAKEKYPSGGLPSIYDNLSEIPKLRVKQSELLELAGVNQKSAGAVQDAIQALHHLGRRQYCFYYTRLVFDENKEPKREKDGREFVKEEVTAVDTLFTIKEVRSKKTGLLEYYEIIPSTIFLDQRESYFMLIPFNWREEVRHLIGKRKASSYTFRFLLFLRYQFELQRRGKKTQFVFKTTAENMAIYLKMPESLYKRHKDRANKILDEVYEVARRLGYLKRYERNESFDILFLNAEKYQISREAVMKPPPLEQDSSPETKGALELLDILIEEKKKLIPKYNPMRGGFIQEQSCKHIVQLMKQHSFDLIKRVIVWGVTKPYWCNRIGTASKLNKNFEEALAEMQAQVTVYDKGENAEKNRRFSLEIAKKAKIGKITVDVLNSYVEISDGSIHKTCIAYSEKGFKDQLLNAIRKRGLRLDENLLH